MSSIKLHVISDRTCDKVNKIQVGGKFYWSGGSFIPFHCWVDFYHRCSSSFTISTYLNRYYTFYNFIQYGHGFVQFLGTLKPGCLDVDACPHVSEHVHVDIVDIGVDVDFSTTWIGIPTEANFHIVTTFQLRYTNAFHFYNVICGEIGTYTAKTDTL